MYEFGFSGTEVAKEACLCLLVIIACTFCSMFNIQSISKVRGLYMYESNGIRNCQTHNSALLLYVGEVCYLFRGFGRYRATLIYLDYYHFVLVPSAGELWLLR